MPTEVLKTLSDLRSLTGMWRSEGCRVAVVPTMGGLHEGHLSLVRLALEVADRVIVTIFVNPKQFDNPQDLAAYPNVLDEDTELLKKLGVACIYCPEADEIYPPGFGTIISVARITNDLCGAYRPGHFDGVSTVVAKLFLQTGADVAVFGEKDYQQLLLVKNMVRDLDIPISVIGHPTVREADGLAMSSRNRHLTRQQREIAAHLPKTLCGLARRLSGDCDNLPILQEARDSLVHAGFSKLEYLEIRDAEDLTLASKVDRPCRLFAAVWLAETRLIDNVEIPW